VKYHHPVKQLMREGRVQDIREIDSLAHAIQILDDCNISALPVRSVEGKYCGVLSKSDIASKRLLKMLKANRSPDGILVQELMNRTTPLFVMENATVQDAIVLMHRRHVHRLFVADADYQMIGVVSTSDIMRFLTVNG
jgi:CBS domain-containing protein